MIGVDVGDTMIEVEVGDPDRLERLEQPGVPYRFGEGLASTAGSCGGGR